MAKKKELYNYKNERYAFIRDPMRNVISAFSNAAKWYATIKEVTWVEFGLVNTTDAIHALEHIQYEYIDEFKGIMAQVGLEVEYPPTQEFIEELADLDKVFEVCVGIADETNDALCEFISKSKDNEFQPLARQVEQLQIENYKNKRKLLEAWSMWDMNPSYSSFDNWVKHLYESEDED